MLKTLCMIITIETSGIQEVEQLLQVLKSLNIKNVSINGIPLKQQPVITQGNKRLDTRALFGIWQGNRE